MLHRIGWLRARRSPWCKTVSMGLALFMPVTPVVANQLSLQKAEAIALHQNPDLAALTQKVAALQHRAVAVAQLPDPHLSVGSENLPASSFAMNQQQMSMLSISLSQTFPPFGKLGLKGRQVAMQARAVTDSRRAQAAELILLLRRAWLQAVAAADAARIVRHQEQVEAESVQAALARYRAARAPESDVLRSELAHDSLANEIDRLKATHAAAVAQITRILNLPKPPSIEHCWPILPRPPTLAALGARLSGQPLLRAARAETRAARIGVEAAQRDRLPQVTVSVGYGRDFFPGSPNWVSASVALSLPIFPQDRQDEAIASAHARSLQAQYRYDDQRRALEREVRVVFARHESLKRQLARTDRRLLPTARDAFLATLDAYAAGQTDLNAVLHTQKAVLGYALARLQYRQGLAESTAELDFLATEGGTQR
ncbi:MAG: TolC family protein [Acidiferrobacteraceae bacterium]